MVQLDDLLEARQSGGEVNERDEGGIIDCQADETMDDEDVNSSNVEDEIIENEESRKSFLMDTSGEIDFDDITVGEPKPGFDIHQSLIYSHNYVLKIDQDRGTCLLCLKFFGNNKILKTDSSGRDVEAVKHILKNHKDFANSFKAQQKYLEEERSYQMKLNKQKNARKRKYMEKVRDELPAQYNFDEEDLIGVTIGKPVKDFRLSSSVLYSHNFYRKVEDNNGISIRALCLMCWERDKTKTFIKMPNNSPKGAQLHMKTFHKTFFEDYIRLRQSVTEMKSLQREQKKSNLSMLKLSPSKQSPQKQSLKSKFEKFEIDLILQEDFKIGEPSIQKFNIQESVCYSHNYFRRNLNIMNNVT